MHAFPAVVSQTRQRVQLTPSPPPRNANSVVAGSVAKALDADTHCVRNTDVKRVRMNATYFHRHPGEVLKTLRAGQDIEVVEKRFGARLCLIRAVTD
jgi:hypothetical protein